MPVQLQLLAAAGPGPILNNLQAVDSLVGSHSEQKLQGGMKSLVFYNYITVSGCQALFLVVRLKKY